MQTLLLELGLVKTVEKATKPHTSMIWLGIQFDSEAMRMSVPLKDLEEPKKNHSPVEY